MRKLINTLYKLLKIVFENHDRKRNFTFLNLENVFVFEISINEKRFLESWVTRKINWDWYIIFS